ncbi:MAG: DEAD/DEAH box helicase [Treponema sp.]|jgi:ATP-dependent Lhr-like helicase|nr:DEAD/DEAH box helicase [Treponema sp.]
MLPLPFHPIINAWFTETYGEPTAVQAEAWPLIEQGEHVLALAPTGSGKTLTAFLSAISRFCPEGSLCAAKAADVPADSGGAAYSAEQLTVLYISPLKALNEDIKRNLLEPLAAIKSRFEKAGLPFPPIRVETRSGDTPQSERRRFLIHPPSILALTPESLAILLLNPKGRQVLSTVKYVILDEIHAVLGNKRGSFLSCQIDRLALIAGEFQRVSLSATVKPQEAAAEFVGGLRIKSGAHTGGTGTEIFEKRTVRIVAPASEKNIDFRVEFPDVTEVETRDIEKIGRYGKRYTMLINYILARVSNHSTILVFTDSRRRAERLCYFLNQEGGNIAFTHHGSLSKDLRRAVEQRLVEGTLPCVVATSSLELGIDIGSVDEVILAGSPGSASQALQRIGRSGHGVGKTSRGSLFPFHGMDLLLATAVEGAVRDRDIEDVRPIENPLDVLAQLILALCVEKKRNIDELYELLKGFYIFRSLNRSSYDRTVKMLAGLGENGRLRELKPRIYFDAVTGELTALDGALLLLYSSGGVIANRGLYSLRIADGAKIGELDEEFVWERRIGDCFDFGSRGWRIISISSESVEVVPLDSPADFIPFWKADTFFRSSNLAKRVIAILDQYSLQGKISAPDSLNQFLASQVKAQGAVPLPGSGNLTIEIIDSPGAQGDFYSVVIHSFRGGAINYPLSLALSRELEEKLQLRLEAFPDDNSILLLIPRLGEKSLPGENRTFASSLENLIRRSFTALNETESGGTLINGSLIRGERLFRKGLESSGVFGAMFREAAERSLLLPKAGFGKRTPLWIMRQKSKRLFDAVSGEGSFPVTAEAWRSCLLDMFDMDGFRDLLCSIGEGAVTLSFFRSSAPSPFSRDTVRQETNTLIYESDERKDLSHTAAIHGEASLSDKVIEGALGHAELRPKLQRELCGDFTSRLRRELPGWAPEDSLSLAEWVKERIAIPLDEWEILKTSLPENLKDELSRDASLENRIVIIKRAGADSSAVVHREWKNTWETEAAALLGPWLRYEGPLPLSRIREVFGLSAAEAEDAVEALVEAEEAIRDVEITIPEDTDTGQTLSAISNLVCDRENLELLLRLSRKKSRPIIKERPVKSLVPFLALHQGIAAAQTAQAPANAGPAPSNTALPHSMPWKSLLCLSAPAKLWETEFFTARCPEYNPEILDREILEGKLVWFGDGKERAGFCAPEDLDLVLTDPKTGTLDSAFFDRPRDFWEIKEALKLTSRSCAGVIWKAVWLSELTADSWEPVRRGIEFGFIPKDLKDEAGNDKTSPDAFLNPSRPLRHIPIALLNKWREGSPVRGNWFSLSEGGGEEAGQTNDPLAEAELNRDRIRLLLDRWGILCRPLLERESPAFSWSHLLPAMRRMELAGELVAGRFFSGIHSLQLASPRIIKDLEAAESNTGMYWMNAADPASPAGLDVEGLDPRLPARTATSRLCFKGDELIAVSNKSGKELHIFIEHDDPCLDEIIAGIKIPRLRKVHPEKKLVIENINEKPAATGEYASVFIATGFVADRGKLFLW